MNGEMDGREYEFEAICGKRVTVVTDDPEYYETLKVLCHSCPKRSCEIYFDWSHHLTYTIDY